MGVMPAKGSFVNLPDAIGERAQEFAVDINGPAAHAVDDAGVLGFGAVKASEDDILAGRGPLSARGT